MVVVISGVSGVIQLDNMSAELFSMVCESVLMFSEKELRSLLLFLQLLPFSKWWSSGGSSSLSMLHVAISLGKNSISYNEIRK